MQPTKEELLNALDVFEAWLSEEAREAEQQVSRQFKVGTTKLEELAELAGVARGIDAAAELLRARVAALK